MRRTPVITADMILRILFLGLFTLLYLVSRQLPETVAGELGPGGWPQVLLILLIVATLLSLAQSVYSIHLRKGAPAESVQSEILGLRGASLLRLLAAIAMSAAYLFLLTRIGFVLSTFLIMTGMAVVMRYPSIWKAALIAGLVVVALALLFGRLMFVPLPRGYGIFRQISFLLY